MITLCPWQELSFLAPTALEHEFQRELQYTRIVRRRGMQETAGQVIAGGRTRRTGKRTVRKVQHADFPAVLPDPGLCNYIRCECGWEW